MQLPTLFEVNQLYDVRGDNKLSLNKEPNRLNQITLRLLETKHS